VIDCVLAIETSCDDTSVAVVGETQNRKNFVHALVSANQDLVHSPFGGIVPEIASRNHTQYLLPLVDECLKMSNIDWSRIKGIAVTSRPGLLGSLLVGVTTAKTLAFAHGLPLLGVNHLEAHLLAPFLSDDTYEAPSDFDYPYVALAVSGGHTQLYFVKGLGQYEVLGRTLDDAAGEAFDKFAKLVGLGFPGGPKVDQLARPAGGSAGGDPKRFSFPRPLIREDNFDFSFSGLKAAAARVVGEMKPSDIQGSLADLCASFQEAVCDVLVAKLAAACEHSGVSKAVVTGGVSANSRLRVMAQAWGQSSGTQIVVPPLRYCTDNAAMVGLVALRRFQAGEESPLTLRPEARSRPEDFQGARSR
jgi:N6-L-threonylcarbamoyladenine synthase